MIPLVDLTLEKTLSAKIKRRIAKVVDSKNYILGPYLESFEKKFSKFIGVKYAIGVASGTDALRLSLRALGIQRGDKVLTVSLTSPFTVLAIVEEGAIPVFCDVDDKTWTIDAIDAQQKIDKKTKAIVPVHLFGNPCDMISILKLAKEYNLKVIEDACQAHGATIGRRKAGSFGDTGAFSFYPTKNLGAFGDAGAVTTNNRRLANLIKLIRSGGQTRRFWHEYQGVNSRLDEIQSVVLETKLKFLDRNNMKRKALALNYLKALSDLPIKFQETFKKCQSVYHLFAIRAARQGHLQKFLEGKKISTDIYYPYPIHMQNAFKGYTDGNLKITEKLSKELLNLPLHPNLTFKDQKFIIKSIREFFRKN